jgi:type II secretory pathway component PulF
MHHEDPDDPAAGDFMVLDMPARSTLVTDSIDSDPDFPRRHDGRIDPDRAMREMILANPCLGTAEGDLALGVLAALIEQRAPLQRALSKCERMRLSRRPRTALAALSDCIGGGLSVVDTLRDNRRIFGDLAASFVLIGEDRLGVHGSLVRYLQLRRHIHAAAHAHSQLGLRRTTRAFALTAAEGIELSGSLSIAAFLASIETPRRLRKALREWAKSMEDGEEPASELPERGLLRPGFERCFVDFFAVGSTEGSLAPMMRTIATL